MANNYPSPQPDLNRNRLPTLFEVLSRRTLAPVDLFFYYIYMRDQQRSVDYLDFWYASTFEKLRIGDANNVQGSMLLNTCQCAAIMFVNSAGLS